jgi:hypothetical protein
MIANSLTGAAAVFITEKSIKYDPARSAPKTGFGDKLSLTSGGFASLAAASLPRSGADISLHGGKCW